MVTAGGVINVRERRLLMMTLREVIVAADLNAEKTNCSR